MCLQNVYFYRNYDCQHALSSSFWDTGKSRLKYLDHIRKTSCRAEKGWLAIDYFTDNRLALKLVDGSSVYYTLLHKQSCCYSLLLYWNPNKDRIPHKITLNNLQNERHSFIVSSTEVRASHVKVFNCIYLFGWLPNRLS